MRTTPSGDSTYAPSDADELTQTVDRSEELPRGRPVYAKNRVLARPAGNPWRMFLNRIAPLMVAAGLLLFPAGAAAAGWSAPASVDSGAALNSVSCPSATFCAAVDSAGNALTFNGSVWSAPVAVQGLTYTEENGDLYSDPHIVAVSCPSASFCMALADGGDVINYNGSVWSVYPWSGGGSSGAFTAVSCLSASFCATTTTWGNSSEPSIFNGTNWNVGDVGKTNRLTSVSCPSITFCMVTDAEGNAATYNGSVWSPLTHVDPDPIRAGTGIMSVSCASPVFCVAVDGARSALRYNGSGWSAPAVITQSTPGYITSVSCPTSSFCTAVDGGEAIVFNGSAWSGPQNISGPYTGDGFSGLTSVSCPTASFCAAVDASGQALTYQAPIVKPPVIVKDVAPANTARPAINGKLKVKAKLSASTGSWSGTAPIAYRYQWLACDGKLKNGKLRNCKKVPGASRRTLTLTRKLAGHRLEVTLTATNSAGSISATSKATAPVKR